MPRSSAVCSKKKKKYQPQPSSKYPICIAINLYSIPSEQLFFVPFDRLEVKPSLQRSIPAGRVNSARLRSTKLHKDDKAAGAKEKSSPSAVTATPTGCIKREREREP